VAGRGSVLSGLRAAQNYAASSAGASAPHPSYVSPLLGQYAQWTMGRQSQSMALPRDPLEFLTGAFGPLAPIKPIGVDQPPPGDDRPMPRRWQYPVAWNMPVGTPGSEGLKLADFQSLRLYADIYSVARACIQLRKDEILGVGWDIGPTQMASKAMRGDKKGRKNFDERREELMKFFRRPDPDYNDFTTWLEAVLEEVLVVDALSIYLHPSRLPGKGILGSSLAGLDILDGATIRPMLDLRGGVPAAPNPAYQQYLYGVPRTDLMTILMGEDVKDLDMPVQEYRGDQLLYLPRNPRTWTPYGQAPMERCIVPVITGLRRQQYQMDYYLEGTIPGMFIAPGDPDLTPNQLREIQDTLNALSGDQAWKHKIIVLPPGSKIDPQKPPVLSDQTDEVLMTEVLMAYSVMPLELGILPKVAATQTPSASRLGQGQEDVQERKTLKPDLLWLKNALFDRVIQGICGQQDMEWRWDGLEEDKDELTMTQLLAQQIEVGLLSIDEGRLELGRDPWGMELTQDPGWGTAAGFMPLGAINPDTGMPNIQESQGFAPNGVPAIPGSPAGTSRSGNVRQGSPPVAPGPRRPASAGPAAPPPPRGARPASPAHAGATASEARNAGTPRPARKAMDAEAEALRRHLHKGRRVLTWETRYLPSRAVASLSEDLAKGLTIDQCIDVMKATLPKDDTAPPKRKKQDGPLRTIGSPGSDIGPSYGVDHGGVYQQWETSMLTGNPGIEAEWDFQTTAGAAQPGGLPVQKAAPAAKIKAQLAEDYPEDSMDWIDDLEWSGPAEVPLSDIDTGNKKTWNAYHEPDRIRAIEAKIRRSARKGGHIKPAVLVDAPDTKSQTHLIVIDGHHRTLASLRADEALWAYVGKAKTVRGPWLTFHNHQDKESVPGTDSFADEPHAR
jgi:hypothetical protein